jgi:hypothetical protein
MKKLKIYLVAAMIGLTALTIQSCQKGEDDPVVSLKTRKDRFTNTWVLTKYEKNGVNQDLSGSTYTYEVYNSGRLTQTIEGAVFGFPTKSVKEGDWVFVNDEEDVRITIEGTATTYNVQRLATNELWLKKLENGNTHVYYFETK